MPDTINLPLIGPANKTVVVAVAGSAVAVTGFLIYRHIKKANTAATAAATPTAYGYGTANSYGYGTYGYGNPPGEYYGYGSGGGGSTSGDYYGYGPYGYGLYGPNGQYLGGGSGTGTGSGGTSPATPTTNAVWTQDCLTVLTGQGYAGETVLAALGLYLTGGTLSSSQQSVVQAAIASEGYPPVTSPSGYPPGMHTAPAPGQTTKVSVPNVVGMAQEDAYKALGDVGLKPSGTATVKGKTLTVQSESPKAGTQVNKGSTVKLTSKVVK